MTGGSTLVGVRMRVAPLPVIFLLPFAGVCPIVIFLVMFLQVLMPMRIFGIGPYMAVMVLRDERGWGKQRSAQKQCA